MNHSQTGLPSIKRLIKRPREMLLLRTPRRGQLSMRSVYNTQHSALLPHTPPPQSPHTILATQQSMDEIQATSRKIDSLLQQFSKKMRHASYLEETKKNYIVRMENMEQEINELKNLIKLRDMNSDEKEIIDRLMAKSAEYKQECDSLFNVVYNLKKKVGGIQKTLVQVLKEKERIEEENKLLSKKLLLATKKPSDYDATFRDVIDKYLKSEVAKTSRLFKFIQEHRELNPMDLLCEMSLFAEVPLKPPQTITPKLSRRFNNKGRMRTSPSIDPFS